MLFGYQKWDDSERFLKSACLGWAEPKGFSRRKDLAIAMGKCQPLVSKRPTFEHESQFELLLRRIPESHNRDDNDFSFTEDHKIDMRLGVETNGVLDPQSVRFKQCLRIRQVRKEGEKW